MPINVELGTVLYNKMEDEGLAANCPPKQTPSHDKAPPLHCRPMLKAMILGYTLRGGDLRSVLLELD